MIAARSLTKPEPIAANALVVLHAAEFSRDLGLQNLTVEGDVFQVVNAVESTHGEIGVNMDSEWRRRVGCLI